ncbi:hypothetical protein [Flavobacterium sp. GT3R68]|uniref:hypothetical protein n=1 Tax=Flavobacterium sp. GT3R68 TaxID=2594437 RepID=UPI000F8603F7|nr:hypothetical protein [Flavobacterium sp. GT3R68]RTY85834.1 hypothetical protein EKL32_28300 [Flavobacterium sp. GSN2]TRW89362.1 hypothetical protein FNW07_13395 [Flavobacterium sp. GT3R68]
MTTKYSAELQFELLKFHCEKDLNLNQNLQIRTVRVLKRKRFKNINPWLLLFFSNDELVYRENHITFYTIHLKHSKETFLTGIEFEYIENGTKNETRVYFKPINLLLNNLLSSKYDIVINKTITEAKNKASR